MKATPTTESKVPAHQTDGLSGAKARANSPGWFNREWIVAIISGSLLAAGLILDHFVQPAWFHGFVRIFYYSVSYLPVGLPVVLKGIRLAFRGEIFTEFFLMSLATVGAFYIGEYPEAVGVMLFYTIGELFQGAAVARAKHSIKALLDVRPSTATVVRNGTFSSVDPNAVAIGETIMVRPGERVPLDSTMISERGSFNTSALTGESKPRTIDRNDNVLAGMINEGEVIELRVKKAFHDSSLARILALVQNAQGRKAKTELFIRRFAKAYTPAVVLLATGLAFLPYFFLEHYIFEQWLYRALIFLVISCPCALVVAIPLGYFGGIGAGSRNGILFKGSSYLDRMTRIGTVVFDKTGTITKGVFRVQHTTDGGLLASAWFPLAASLEMTSSHPIAKAIVKHNQDSAYFPVTDVEEIRGHGLKGIVDKRNVLVGNAKLLQMHGIDLPAFSGNAIETIVWVAVDGKFAGQITISDEIKDDARTAIDALRRANIHTAMLSGDRTDVVQRIAATVGIDESYGDLLPEDKVSEFENIRKGKKGAVAFVGDGINDAPVIAISDVGIAMGGLGSDAAIETADVVIQTDQPSKIYTAIKIGRATNAIVWQNIALALGVKIVVMALGAWGVASMWEAVFADVGVALLAILNAVRVQRMQFS